MLLDIEHIPIPKKRPRFSTFNGKSRVFNAQNAIVKTLRVYFKHQIQRRGYLAPYEGPIMFKMTAHMPKPKSWSKKRSNEAEGMPHITKPDSSNILKMYEDILNGIAYKDDSQIFLCLCEKYYSDKPKVEIQIISMGDVMVDEHVKTINTPIDITELDYIVKKANSLGESGRRIHKVYSKEDNQGKHIFFEVQSMKRKTLTKMVKV